MKTKLTNSAPGLVAVRVAAIAFAAASADTNPLVPSGPNPMGPYVLGYYVSNHDEAYTTNASWTCRANCPRLE
jgi:hypothetical protein